MPRLALVTDANSGIEYTRLSVTNANLGIKSYRHSLTGIGHQISQAYLFNLVIAIQLLLTALLRDCQSFKNGHC
jgi:hypothetical protein